MVSVVLFLPSGRKSVSSMLWSASAVDISKKKKKTENRKGQGSLKQPTPLVRTVLQSPNGTKDYVACMGCWVVYNGLVIRGLPTSALLNLVTRFSAVESSIRTPIEEM